MDDAPVASLDESLGIYQDQIDGSKQQLQPHCRQQPHHLQTIQAVDNGAQYTSILDAAHSYNNLFVKQSEDGIDQAEMDVLESSASHINPCDQMS